MYEERQRDRAYNEAHGIGQRDHRNDKKSGGFKQITAPLTPAKASGGNDKARDAQGRWHSVTGKTFGGQGEPMNVDTRTEKKQKQMAKGRCFKCDEWGHLSKDCTNKKVAVHTVETDPKEPLAESTKVEEVKD